jgi:hypothetical protein
MAIEWANDISDEARRIDALRSTYRHWRHQNATEAEAWLAKSQLTPAQRQRVTQP